MTGRAEEGELSRRLRQSAWGDVLAVLVLASLWYGLITLARQWTGERRQGPTLDLAPGALPDYVRLGLDLLGVPITEAHERNQEHARANELDLEVQLPVPDDMIWHGQGDHPLGGELVRHTSPTRC